MDDELGDTEQAEDDEVGGTEPVGAVDYRNLAGMLGCTLPVLAIPFVGGVFGLGIGMAGIIGGGRKLREASRHLGEEDETPPEALRTGDVARIRGTVASGHTVQAPLHGKDAVFVVASVARTTSNVGDEHEVWREVHAEPFEIRWDGGTAMVDASRANLLTASNPRRGWDGAPADEVAEIMGAAAGRLDTTYSEKGVVHEHSFEYREPSIAAGQEVTVSGTVEDAQESRLAGTGYRQGKPTMRLAIAAELVTSLSDRGLRRRLRKHRTMYVAGIVSLVLGVANAVGFGLWFFA